ncbi:MAG: EamA/RhaT family transporter [Cryomorphaceae bacterium]
MIYLVLSILASIGLLVAFKMFANYGVHTRQGIMINYLVAGGVAWVVFGQNGPWLEAPWFLPSCALGVLFYLIFRVMAKVTQTNGMAVSSTATKMSVVIPVSVGLFVLNESFSTLKFIGIILGLVSIVLSVGGSMKRSDILWPLILFLGSGTIDAALKLFQYTWVSDEAFPLFIANVFLSAFVVALSHHIFTKERTVSFRTMVGGLGLGLVNLGALYFILLALALPSWESSVVFPINNFGIIAGSTLLAVFVLKERVTPRGWMGFVLASLSILILYLSR